MRFFEASMYSTIVLCVGEIKHSVRFEWGIVAVASSLSESASRYVARGCLSTDILVPASFFSYLDLCVGERWGSGGGV